MVVVMEDTVAVTADTVGAEVAEQVGTAGTATSTVIIISHLITAGATAMAGGVVTAIISVVVIGRT